MNMKKEIFILAILLAAVVQAYTLSDYPSFFVQDGKFKAVYVIGEEAPALDVVSATVISTALAKYPNVTTEIGTSRIDSEIADITKENAIVIGSPCENSAAAQLEGNPQPCHRNLAGSVGYLKLFEKNGKFQLLVTGLTAEDRHQAAKFLANQNLDRIEFKEYIVPTSTNSTPSFFSRNGTKLNAANTAKQVKPAPVPTATQQKTEAQEIKEEPIGEYEELEELPPQKNFFIRFWRWIMGLF